MTKKHIGMGVMLSILAGKKPVDHFTHAHGKLIKKAWIEDNRLWIGFEDGDGITLFDDGQSCCETRYMHTEDDLDYYVGATFEGVEIVNAATPENQEDFYVHEIQFLDVITSMGMFQIVNHNEHNGYYGGFALTVLSWKELKK